jgi:hypothetical protein
VKETDTPPSESTTEPKAEDATNTAEEGKGEGTPADEGESKTGEDVAGVEDGKPGEDAAEANVDGKETGAAEAQPATDGKTTVNGSFPTAIQDEKAPLALCPILTCALAVNRN